MIRLEALKCLSQHRFLRLFSVVGFLVDFSMREGPEIYNIPIFWKIVQVGELPFRGRRPAGFLFGNVCMIFHQQGSFFLHAQMRYHFVKI